MKCKFEDLCEYGYCEEDIECYHFEQDVPQNVENAVTCINTDICKSVLRMYLEYDTDFIYVDIYEDIDIEALDWDKLDQYNLSDMRIIIRQNNKKLIIEYK